MWTKTFACLAILGLVLPVIADQANPIRKVVGLLQDIQKQVEAEGAKEKELFDKFMCFCTGNTGALQKGIDDNKAKLDELDGRLKAETAEKGQLALDLVRHKEDMEGAQADLAKADALRSKELAKYEADSGEAKANVASLASAIHAIEQGMGAASLVQMPGGVADRLRRLLGRSSLATELDRQQVTSFLEAKAGQDYVPQSGQIVGILKNIDDEVKADLARMTAEEEAAAKNFGDLKATKEAQIAMAAKAIKSKTSRAGELAVSIVQADADVGDTTSELTDGQKFLANLMTACPAQEKLFAEQSKARADEVSAVGEAIAMLNDDDALEVFKKAVPASFMQGAEQGVRRYGFLQRRQDSRAAPVARVQALLAGVAQSGVHSQRMGLMLFMARSKLRLARSRRAPSSGNITEAPSFGNITGMIENMIVLEGEEQANDDHMKPWCNGEFEKSDREEKGEKTEMSSLEATMEEQTDAIAGLDEEIKSLMDEVAALDKTVAEATEQRKEEHAEYVEALSLTQTAIAILGKAKDRLAKFYNPALHKGSPKAEEAFFAQIDVSRSRHTRVAPPEMPEGVSYEKKSKQSGGVVALMDKIIKDLHASLSDIEHDEGTAQKDYVELMGDSAASRASDMKSVTDKESAKAEITAQKVAAKEKLMANLKDLEVLSKYVTQLHGSCDFILENYGIRKEARAAEIKSLEDAKAILAGATY